VECCLRSYVSRFLLVSFFDSQAFSLFPLFPHIILFERFRRRPLPPALPSPTPPLLKTFRKSFNVDPVLSITPSLRSLFPNPYAGIAFFSLNTSDKRFPNSRCSFLMLFPMEEVHCSHCSSACELVFVPQFSRPSYVVHPFRPKLLSISGPFPLRAADFRSCCLKTPLAEDYYCLFLNVGCTPLFSWSFL